MARHAGDRAGAALAAALVNTRPRPANPREALPDAAAAVALLAAHGVEAGEREAAAALPALRVLREDLLGAFGTNDMAALAAALNPQLARAPADELPLADRVALLAARGLAELAASHGLERLGYCAAEDCQAVYADASPRGARRFCSRTCATRVNVRRHRAAHEH